MTSTDFATSYDVLVVGAGPAGLTTATALARTGVRVLVVEKHPGLSIFPKATGLRPRTMEILRSWGVEDLVRSRSGQARLTMGIRPVLTAPGGETSLGFPSEEELSLVSPGQIAVFPQGPLGGVPLNEYRDRGGEGRFPPGLGGLRMDQGGIPGGPRSAEGTTSTIRGGFLV